MISLASAWELDEERNVGDGRTQVATALAVPRQFVQLTTLQAGWLPVSGFTETRANITVSGAARLGSWVMPPYSLQRADVGLSADHVVRPQPRQKTDDGSIGESQTEMRWVDGRGGYVDCKPDDGFQLQARNSTTLRACFLECQKDQRCENVFMEYVYVGWAKLGLPPVACTLLGAIAQPARACKSGTGTLVTKMAARPLPPAKHDEAGPSDAPDEATASPRAGASSAPWEHRVFETVDENARQPSEPLALVLTWGGVKVLPSQSLSMIPTPGAAGPFVLSAARNEYEQLQVVLAGPAAVEGVRVSVSGADLRWSVYRVGYINVTKLTDCYSFAPNGRAPFATPEHLIPDVDAIDGQRRSAFPLSVPAGQVRSVIVDFFVPETQCSGNFSATIEVLGDPGRSGVDNILGSH